jgi:hypothetical protein
MRVKKNEMHRVPGFTAENALEQGARAPYAGLASRGAGGGAVEAAFSQTCRVIGSIGGEPVLWCVRHPGPIYIQ